MSERQSKMKKWIISVAFLFLVLTALHSQRFGAAVVFGPTLSQVLGEGNAGYDKFGVSGGLQAIAYLNERVDVNVELLYSQRGSRSSLIPRSFIERNGFNFDYVEVPISLLVKDWIQTAEDGTTYGKMGIYVGASYGRLISSKAIGFDERILDEVSNHDLSFLLGLRFQWNRHWAVNARYTRSLRPIAPEFSLTETNPLRPYSINLRVEYIL